ncbi:LysR family transcriptional regulator [Cysteiniphilum halobium]|uniref:LysR family transcriptional regulator n=1 Tax=Cysteiniphilum halobium TaxID=2219059 RepID=UPI0013C3616D|nr:LysR family transcriptional regulator [Cysteiniphilum halobium]
MPDHYSLSLSNMEAFITVVRLGSFSKAAKHLGVSPAAISKTIRQLEVSIGTALLMRTTRSVKPTSEGHTLYQQFNKVIVEIDIAKEIIEHINDTPNGVLKINCNPMSYEKFLLPVIIIYRQKFPHVQIELIHHERPIHFNDFSIDIIFGSSWIMQENIIARKIMTTRDILCASPDYIKKHGLPKTLTELLRKPHQFIKHAGRPHLIRGAEEIEHLNIAMMINDMEFIKKATIKSLGVAQFHEYFVESEIKNNQLVEILSNEYNPEIDLYIFYKKDPIVLPKVRHFIDIFSRYFDSG